MLIRVKESSHKFVLLGRVNGNSIIQFELENGVEYFDVIAVVFADIVISGSFCKEAQPEQK